MNIKRKKKQKNDKTNILFFTNCEILKENEKNFKKKKNLRLKKKIYFFVGKWDKTRKLFSILKKNEYLNLFSIFSFLTIEDIIFTIAKNLHSKILKLNKNEFTNNWLRFFIRCDWNLFEFLIYFFIKKKGYNIHHFKLADRIFISPKFICWKKKNLLESVFSILFLKKNFSFTPSYLLSSLLTRIKPGLLKIVILGKNHIIFFSVDLGFSNSCPIFVNINSKKRKKKLLNF
jgi:hypothetical protein